jgi:hypothetical protein
MPLTELYDKVGANAKPAFTVTQPGDPARQAELKATLPNIYTATKVTEMRELHEIKLILSRSATYDLRDELLDLEMSLCGGG